MDNKPIDIARLGVIRCVIAPEPRMTPEGEVRRDREGNPLWITALAVRQPEGRRTDVIHVVTSGQPQGLTEGSEVKVTNLWANDWSVDGRSGTTYRADAITSVQVSVGGGSSPAAAPTGPRGKSSGGES
ncbi:MULTISPECIES: hypothetical protein [Streptomyces]|uniref:hypothetical protein n=1 Tax=Streptomyces TaxID=1883 RepID=UPI00073DD6B4|nr:hypothetical protein [Streptomyces sp. EAS-AB2608]MYU29590.1 hypothetical protein [Streptomyces sp. SID7810]BCM69018.1 hypothetical protein EASAB2608_04352 [Streptomyces sp. EAS-AB2608]CUW30649.1 hypothetical protein TUE45_05383 [Streptomyces reticuli]